MGVHGYDEPGRTLTFLPFFSSMTKGLGSAADNGVTSTAICELSLRVASLLPMAAKSLLHMVASSSYSWIQQGWRERGFWPRADASGAKGGRMLQVLTAKVHGIGTLH